MKHKSMKTSTLAAVLALSMSVTALAGVPVGGGGKPPSASEIEGNADTTISILQTASTQPNISYTVPLYVTMAVVNDDPVVKVPTNYNLTNTTQANTDGSPVNIGVTNMSFEKLSTANGFNTVADAAAVGTEPQNIFLQIGGETMPALSTPGIQSFVPSGTILVKDGQPFKLASGASLNLAINGTVAKTVRTDTKTAAQFRVKYTVSLLDASGQALGAVYAGDDRSQAGLEPWVEPVK